MILEYPNPFTSLINVRSRRCIAVSSMGRNEGHNMSKTLCGPEDDPYQHQTSIPRLQDLPSIATFFNIKIAGQALQLPITELCIHAHLGFGEQDMAIKCWQQCTGTRWVQCFTALIRRDRPYLIDINSGSVNAKG